MKSPDRILVNDLSRTPPEVMSAIEAAIARVLASGWFVMGPEHEALQRELSAYLGVSDTVLVGNGTDALTLALAAVGVGVGDRVLTVANAGAYTTTAARLLGAVPVYCDVSAETLLMTPELVRRTLATSELMPKAVVITHLFGAMAPAEEIAAVAREYAVAVVEDCAQSIGARSAGRQSGTFGDIATASFYPTKNLGALGDGGAVFTNDPELAEAVRRMRQYGWESKYHIGYDRGRNSRMDEMQAAIVRVKLPLLDSLNDRRREIHSRYSDAASPAVTAVSMASESFIAHLAAFTTKNRDAVRATFNEQGVSTDVHYPVPDHLQNFPTNRPAPVSLPVTERAAQTIFSIPMFPELTDREVDHICGVLRMIKDPDGNH